MNLESKRLRLCIVLLLGFIASRVHGATITCPTLTCDTTLGTDIGFIHSSDNPVTSIKMAKCASNEVCYFEDNEFAWITSKKQEYTASSNSGTGDSQIYFKNTKYKCENAGEFQFKLNNGQPGGTSRQCVSMKCDNSKCAGFGVNTGCKQHADCAEQLACIKSTSWPYAGTCLNWKSAGDTCVDDYDCSPLSFGWYASAAAVGSSTKTCLEKFSQVDGTTFGWSYTTTPNDNGIDGLYHGQYCNSGFARMSATDTATGMSITKIESDLGVQTNPYKGTATDTTNNCKYYYDATNSVTSQCQCALDGTTGYCPVPGQDEINTYVSYLKSLNNVNKCHTLDRSDFRRLREQGLINGKDENYNIWKNAAGIHFNVTYWPFIQGTAVAEGMQEIFYLSASNLAKERSAQFSPLLVLTSALMLITFYL